MQRSTEDESGESTIRRVVHFWKALGNSGIATLGCMLWGIMLCDNTVRKADGYLWRPVYKLVKWLINCQLSEFNL